MPIHQQNIGVPLDGRLNLAVIGTIITGANITENLGVRILTT